MSIETHEREIIGKHFLRDGKVVADFTCERIEELILNYLQYIVTDESGWVQLYREPDSGRLWKKEYPESNQHGGGPPSLLLIDKGEAILQFDTYNPETS